MVQIAFNDRTNATLDRIGTPLNQSKLRRAYAGICMSRISASLAAKVAIREKTVELPRRQPLFFGLLAMLLDLLDTNKDPTYSFLEAKRTSQTSAPQKQIMPDTDADATRLRCDC